MNKVILMGRLTRDPEVRYGQCSNNTAVCKYSLAVNRRFRKDGDPEADFFNCTVFGKGAEFAEKYFKKGQQVLITGRIQQDNYTNKNGEKVYSVQVIVDEQEFADSKNGGNGGNGGSFGGASQGAPSGAGDGFMNIPEGVEEELPFN